MARLFKTAFILVSLTGLLLAETNDSLLGEEREVSTLEDSSETILIEEEEGEILLPEVSVEGESGHSMGENRGEGESKDESNEKERKWFYQKISPVENVLKHEEDGEKLPRNEIAEFSAYYGIFNALEAKILFGRDTDILNYFVAFKHKQTDGIENSDLWGLDTYTTSANGQTEARVDLNYANNSVVGGFFFSFDSQKQDLFDTKAYSKLKEQSLALTWYNEALFKKGGLSAKIDGQYNYHDFESGDKRLGAKNFLIAANVKFDYLFTENNYFISSISYDYSHDITDILSEGMWLFSLGVKDGFTLVSPLFIALGGTFNLDGRVKASADASAVVRYQFSPDFSIFASYEMLNDIPSFANIYISEERAVLVENATTPRLTHEVKAGLDLLREQLGSLSAIYFTKWQFSHPLINTNSINLYSYTLEDLRTIGFEIKGQTTIKEMLSLSLFTGFSHYSISRAFAFEPILDIEADIAFEQEKWGFIAKVLLPLSLKYNPDGLNGEKVQAFFYPSIILEKTIGSTVTIALRFENLSGIQESFDILFPRAGRTYHIGIKIKL